MKAEKYNIFTEKLKEVKKIAIAFSGGVDSAFLLKAALDTLGRENVMALTIEHIAIPKEETKYATDFCNSIGVEQRILPFDILAVKGIRSNPKERCYLCKYAMFSLLCKEAKEQGFLVVAEGTNADDVSEYRPGRKALEELHILSPLKEAGIRKEEIRTMLADLRLAVATKPSSACLLTRFAYKEEITKEKIQKVMAAEHVLSECGFSQFRVRMHGDIARIEIPEEEFFKMETKELRNKIKEELLQLGFLYVTLDLAGFCSGSMDKTIDDI